MNLLGLLVFWPLMLASVSALAQQDYVSFANKTQYLDCGRFKELQEPFQKFTVEVTLRSKKKGGTGLQAIVGAWSQIPEQDQFLLYITPGNHINFAVGNGISSQSPACVTSELLDHRWYHVKATYEQGKQSVYINGELSASCTQEGEPTWNTQSILPVRIGAEKSMAGDRFFEGEIKDVVIYVEKAIGAIDTIAKYVLNDPTLKDGKEVKNLAADKPSAITKSENNVWWQFRNHLTKDENGNVIAKKDLHKGNAVWWVEKKPAKDKGTTGSESYPALNFSIYPNPSHSQSIVIKTEQALGQDIEYQVFDLSGRFLERGIFYMEGKEQTIPIWAKPGHYLLALKTTDGRLLGTKNFILN